MPIMDVSYTCPAWTQDSPGGWGTRGDPREWQNPTASPYGHDEDDDETLACREGDTAINIPWDFH